MLCLELPHSPFALAISMRSRRDVFPSHPVTLIVPGLPGGGFDPIARAISEHSAKSFGQPVVLDHKPGGTMTIGPATMVANAKTDGHTVSMIVSTIVS